VEIRVETYSGYKADEYPQRMCVAGVWIDIIDVEDRWYGPGYSYFRVYAGDAQRYILKLDVRSGKWSIPDRGRMR
jgi:hypothetical protein